MGNLNTKIIFYWIVIENREFKKVVFQTILAGEPFNSIHDVQKWEQNKTSDIFNKYDFTIVFDHVILQYSPTYEDVHDVYPIDELQGTLNFKSKIKKVRNKKNNVNLKHNLKDLKKQIEEIKICDAIKYDLIESDYLKLKLKYLTLEIENIILKQQIIDTNKKVQVDKKQEYQSIWIDRSGNIYNVGFACHEEFAQDILNKRDVELEIEEYAYVVLQNEGWIRVLGWTDPPLFVLPEQITPKQKSALREYCQSQKIKYSAMPDILKEY
jgi:hypothetical protein